MRQLRGTSDRDIERLLDGEALGHADLDEVATHLRNLRALCARVPGDDVARRHIAAAVAAARTRALGAAPRGAAPSVSQRRGFMHRTRVALARLAAGAVAVTGATAGLAYAGVDLPGQAAEQAFEAVLNVELPNQGAPEEAASTDARSAEAGAVAERVRAVIEAWTGERGCEFGQAVAAAARGDAEGGPAEDPCTKSDAAAEGSKATGAEKSAAGKARAEDARAAAAEKAAAAEIRAAEKAAAGTATGAEKSGSGQTTAEEKSSTGKATAEEKSSAGKATGEEKSSGAGENSQKP